MNCKGVHEQLLQLTVERGAAPAELESHFAACAACAREWAQLQQTMALLDEWQAPEPSAYFDVRLQARLREEQRKARITWRHWLTRPTAVGIAATILLALGVGSYLGTQDTFKPAKQVAATRGTAVGDLQYLEKNSDLLQEFEALDVLDHDSGSSAN
jgi:anti-sigma factor RsiW